MGSTILRKVEEGMRVYDRNNETLGTVSRVYLGASSEEAIASGLGPGTARDPSLGAVAPAGRIREAFLPPSPVPDELRERLLGHGFVRIDTTGLFTADCYAPPEQIEIVSTEGVRLSVTRDELTSH
jgi:hypothetical protein